MQQTLNNRLAVLTNKYLHGIAPHYWKPFTRCLADWPSYVHFYNQFSWCGAKNSIKQFYKINLHGWFSETQGSYAFPYHKPLRHLRDKHVASNLAMSSQKISNTLKIISAHSIKVHVNK